MKNLVKKLDKEIMVCGNIQIGTKERYSFYLGKVKDFVRMDEEGWAYMQMSILQNMSGIHWHKSEHNKIEFVSEIDEMRKRNEKDSD